MAKEADESLDYATDKDKDSSKKREAQSLFKLLAIQRGHEQRRQGREAHRRGWRPVWSWNVVGKSTSSGRKQRKTKTKAKNKTKAMQKRQAAAFLVGEESETQEAQ